MERFKATENPSLGMDSVQSAPTQMVASSALSLMEPAADIFLLLPPGMMGFII